MIFLYRTTDVVTYFSLKYHGDWKKIYDAIKNKEKIDDNHYLILKEKCDYKIMTILDENYPQVLKNIYQPPFALFYHGDINLLNDNQGIAMIGSRNASEYGRKSAMMIASELAKRGHIVISGFARGIDTICHQSCIEANGKTIGILGGGINNCYPKENYDLYQIMKKDHLLISEYPFDIIPQKDYFPFRNRLIAALGQKLIVIEVRKRSGTLITISHALSMGRDIWCVPYPIGSDTCNNQLIKEGAYLLEETKDIWE